MARDPYRYFRIEARDLAEQLSRSLLELERTGSGGEVVPRLLRLAHTLKGAARVVRLPEIADQAHMIEDLLTPFRDTVKSVPSGMHRGAAEAAGQHRGAGDGAEPARAAGGRRAGVRPGRRTAAGPDPHRRHRDRRSALTA